MMSSWIIALYPLLILGLTGIAIYYHHKMTSLSLPVSPLLTIFPIALPLVAALHTFYQPALLRQARAKTASTLSQLFPVLLQALQLIITSVLATLLSSDAIPSPVRECLLETKWKRFWTEHDAEAIRRVQDALNCCGFRSVKDMAWPFPSGGPGGGTGESCAVKFGRTVACKGPWEQSMQSGAGWDVAVVVAVGLVQLFGWAMGSKFAEVRWRESFWGRLVGRLFGGFGGRGDESERGGRDGMRPLLTDGQSREGDVEGGEGGQRYGGTEAARGHGA